MPYRKLLLSIVCFHMLINTAFAQSITLSKDVKQAMEQIKPDEIKADVTYLADDRLKGRAPGTEGYQVAVDYVIDRLKSLNVLPAGEKGTWLQTVKFRKAFTKDAVLSLNDGQVENTRAREYIIYPNPVVSHVKVSSSSLVFAGYGISEPALGYDDYKGLDVKGKTVVILRGSPAQFSSSVAAHTMNNYTILKTAAAHGAVGVIMGTADSTVKTLPDISQGVISVMDEKGKAIVSRTWYNDQIAFVASAGYNFLNMLFKDTGFDLVSVVAQMKEGKTGSFPITKTINVSYSSVYKDFTSYNVVGKINGSDRNLKKEYVVHSAHLDHLGISKPIEGDSIYNGAHDNATGVSSLLEIAKIYKHIKVKPKRSILLVILTGEEYGTLGSGYFARHATVPVKNMVADVNTDMPTIIAPLLSVTALGAEHSTLTKQVNEAAAYLDLTVEPDPEPKQARFTRSDQYSFVVAGIPALHIKYGSKTADGKNNLNETVANWRAKYYHKPQDDINGIFDFNAGIKYAQLNFLIGYLVAQDIARPAWNTGDIFKQ